MIHRTDEGHAFRLDTAIMRHTRFANFAALLHDAKTTPYYPSLRSDLAGDEAAMIADAFDEEMKAIGDGRRAHRS